MAGCLASASGSAARSGGVSSVPVPRTEREKHGTRNTKRNTCALHSLPPGDDCNSVGCPAFSCKCKQFGHHSGRRRRANYSSWLKARLLFSSLLFSLPVLLAVGVQWRSRRMSSLPSLHLSISPSLHSPSLPSLLCLGIHIVLVVCHSTTTPHTVPSPPPALPTSRLYPTPLAHLTNPRPYPRSPSPPTPSPKADVPNHTLNTSAR